MQIKREKLSKCSKLPVGIISDLYRRQVGVMSYATPSQNVAYFHLIRYVSTAITPDYPPKLVRYWSDIGPILDRYWFDNGPSTLGLLNCSIAWGVVSYDDVRNANVL